MENEVQVFRGLFSLYLLHRCTQFLPPLNQFLARVSVPTLTPNMAYKKLNLFIFCIAEKKVPVINVAKKHKQFHSELCMYELPLTFQKH